MSPLKTLWKYYPDKKGICTGISLAAFGFSAMIFNKISEVIINPNEEPIDNETGLYSKEIGLKLPNFFLISSILILVVGLIAAWILVKHEKQSLSINSYLIETNEVFGKNFL